MLDEWMVETVAAEPRTATESEPGSRTRSRWRRSPAAKRSAHI